MDELTKRRKKKKINSNSKGRHKNKPKSNLSRTKATSPRAKGNHPGRPPDFLPIEQSKSTTNALPLKNPLFSAIAKSGGVEDDCDGDARAGISWNEGRGRATGREGSPASSILSRSPFDPL